MRAGGLVPVRCWPRSPSPRPSALCLGFLQETVLPGDPGPKSRAWLLDTVHFLPAVHHPGLGTGSMVDGQPGPIGQGTWKPLPGTCSPGRSGKAQVETPSVRQGRVQCGEREKFTSKCVLFLLQMCRPCMRVTSL